MQTWMRILPMAVAGFALHINLSIGHADELHRYESTRPSMGTLFHFVLYAPDEATANRAFDAAYARVQQLDKTLSDYNEESELSKLSASAPTTKPIPVSDDLFRTLERSLFYARETEGAFDITVGPLTKLWRRSRRQKMLPPADQLLAALAAVGYQSVKLDEQNRTVSLEKPHMRLDVGGIGKGFAADEALAVLKKIGITRATVGGSGDFAIGDPPPGESGWKMGIAPVAADGPPARVIVVSNCGVSTSGDTFQYVEIDGKRYSHIVDPKTGMGLTDPLLVTAIAPCATTSDALDTALSVMGKDRALALAEKLPGVAVLIVRHERDKIETFESSRFKDLKQVK